MSATVAKRFQSTTIRLPEQIYERAKALVERREYASSMNELVVEALAEKLASLEEAAIDAAFAGMADDPAYQRQAVAISREFAHSDWEALERGTKHQPTQPASDSGSPDAE